jgi:hypothetical protein
MECRNHPGVAAVGVCAGCAEAYCPKCLVNVRETRYCASCKSMAVGAVAIPLGTTPCTEASEALRWAILSFFCFGMVLGPLAISKGLKAKKLIAENPALTGSGRAQAAIVLGALALGFWILGMVQRFSSPGR